MTRSAMILEINDDFDLHRIHRSGQCFRWEGIGPDAYRIPFRGKCLRIEKLPDGRYSLDCGKEEYAQTWHDYFDLGEDYARIRSRIDPDEDPFLYHAARKEAGIRILRQDLWETLVSFIISQNRSIPVIRRSVELLCRAAGEQRTDRAGEEYHTFPAPEAVAALAEETLCECKLGYRGRYVRAAAQYALDGGLDSLTGTSGADAIDKLTEICGVGIKVASCVALFALHDLNAFPVDTWVKKVLEHEYPRGYPRDRYGPYNGVYQQYMFACYRNGNR